MRAARPRATGRSRRAGTRPARRRFGRRGEDHGASTVELAILWPVIAAMLFGAIQIACYFTARTVAVTAAQAAVSAERQLGAEPGEGVAHAEEVIKESGDWLRGAEVEGPLYTADGVSYTVTGTPLSIVPGLDSWEVSQTAHGTREQFRGAER